MNPYLFFYDSPEWGCSIAFAENRQQAKVLGHRGYPGTGLYTEARVRRLGDEYMIFAESDGPHLVNEYGIDGWYETWNEALEARLNQEPNGEE